jgi:hypothetical protein
MAVAPSLDAFRFCFQASRGLFFFPFSVAKRGDIIVAVDHASSGVAQVPRRSNAPSLPLARHGLDPRPSSAPRPSFLGGGTSGGTGGSFRETTAGSSLGSRSPTKVSGDAVIWAFVPRCLPSPYCAPIQVPPALPPCLFFLPLFLGRTSSTPPRAFASFPLGSPSLTTQRRPLLEGPLRWAR